MTTLIVVPSSGTPKQTIRVERALWDAYGEVCAAEGTSRAKAIREHMESKVKAHRGHLPNEPEGQTESQPQS
ncbi:hypothetical protein ACRYCC_26510 [Actinomadura scrupuli]|uniref:hypothetical protein n=1 Tax=Actinomadura scrupuli TaxID=559629 RepID=UPI003D993C4C